MRKSHRDGYTQSYNAQAVVDTEGGQFVVATTVLRTPSDANQLEPALQAVPPSLGTVSCVLADGGYLNADAIEAIQGKGALRFTSPSPTKSRMFAATITARRGSNPQSESRIPA